MKRSTVNREVCDQFLVYGLDECSALTADQVEISIAEADDDVMWEVTEAARKLT